jgi:hypothetical protein
MLVVAFLLLALIAPVWIPAPAVRALAARPSATRREGRLTAAGKQRSA